MSKIVCVTGATSGIGRATAEIFAKNGYNLILTGRRKELLEAVGEELVKKYGDKIMFSITPPAVPRDASDEEIDKAAKEFVDRFAPDFAEKPFLVGTFFADPRFTKAIYKYSRIALS